MSNYTLRHLEELLEQCSVAPQVLQVELHPRYQQEHLVGFCQEQGIHLQVTEYNCYLAVLTVTARPTAAWARRAQAPSSPARRWPGWRKGWPGLPPRSSSGNCTDLSFLLMTFVRWGLQKGYTVLPRSSSTEHVKENMQVHRTSLSVWIVHRASLYVWIILRSCLTGSLCLDSANRKYLCQGSAQSQPIGLNSAQSHYTCLDSAEKQSDWQSVCLDTAQSNIVHRASLSFRLVYAQSHYSCLDSSK